MPLTSHSRHFDIKDVLLKHCQRLNYQAKSPLIYEGEKCDYLYFLLKGTVSVIINSEEGQEMIITYLNEGDFFGESGLFDQKEPHSTWVKAITHCQVARIRYLKFLKLTERHPKLLFALCSQIATRLRNTTLKIPKLAYMEVTERVIDLLLELCRQPYAEIRPVGVEIRITRVEISRIVACSREMAGRALKVLEEKGLIAVNGRKILVYNAQEQLQTQPCGNLVANS